jgi:hypothetical protein
VVATSPFVGDLSKRSWEVWRAGRCDLFGDPGPWRVELLAPSGFMKRRSPFSSIHSTCNATLHLPIRCIQMSLKSHVGQPAPLDSPVFDARDSDVKVVPYNRAVYTVYGKPDFFYQLVAATRHLGYGTVHGSTRAAATRSMGNKNSMIKHNNYRGRYADGFNDATESVQHRRRVRGVCERFQGVDAVVRRRRY